MRKGQEPRLSQRYRIVSPRRTRRARRGQRTKRLIPLLILVTLKFIRNPIFTPASSKETPLVLALPYATLSFAFFARDTRILPPRTQRSLRKALTLEFQASSSLCPFMLFLAFSASLREAQAFCLARSLRSLKPCLPRRHRQAQRSLRYAFGSSSFSYVTFSLAFSASLREI
jgi:hypothetical protein